MTKPDWTFTVEADAPVGETVVFELAERTDEDPATMPPLYESVDPDALDALVSCGGTHQVTFEYADHLIAVAGPA